MNNIDIDQELDALLRETVAGLRQRITSKDANASDFSAAIKVLDAAGIIADIAETKSRRDSAPIHERMLEGLPDFDESGELIHPIRQ